MDMNSPLENSPRVSVLIVNWNGATHLPDCLESLAGQSYTDFETVLVDNGSRDGSVALVRQRYPWVKLIELGENAGFAAGNNIALAHSAGEYLVTLNNDTRVDRHWLEEMVAVADADPAAGMVGCRIVAFDDPDRIDSLGLRITRDGMARGAFRHQRFSSLSLPKTCEILLPSACAALYKRTMLDQVGFFDESFFAYCEDVDLGLRGRWGGCGAVLARDAVVAHKYSLTGGALSPFKLHLVERNHLWVVLKTFPARLLWWLPWWTSIRYVEQLWTVLAARGTGREFLSSDSPGALLTASFRGFCEAFRGSPAALRKRRRLMQSRQLRANEMNALLKTHRLSYAELFDRKTS